MPGLTLHLLALAPSTTAESFLRQLRQSSAVKVILASRPRHIVIPPTLIDSNLLTTTKWDLLVLLQPASVTKEAALESLPPNLQPLVQQEYRLAVGIPSKLLSNYDDRDKSLKRSASSIPLTGSLANARQKSSSKNLELSPDLLAFMDTLTRTHDGPVTMLNLLHFHHPSGKKSYYQYGQAFIPVAGKRGGNAKLVGNVIRPASTVQVDSRGSEDRPETDWWNEISLVHYPSIRHFCDMLAGEDYQAINEKYRLSALRDTFLLCTTEFDVESPAAKL
ncbi:hypothetical protein IFM61606_01822 [Aspergillus udagawae]|uniref:Uncharacterized protein n=1 Tax=Aspergillus udagawae TaxID=91492 RepID=A0A8H3PBS7_9EURO|nr:uncharacterized protein Aud_001502 [Aspergillus udagawae]GFF49336.1 hypothetical protein IFM51744_07056 [Aspergillus udagawae]GFF80074.1 hypothetical protein IFM53868_02764 [Aspergillus udagawae]GFG09597.1 hypothetical protein IFM5058_04499 [Aspergillus udagawae]GFG21969.1 hypothetical protein IFM61606_01822 [Aspergillus udagawae]GIC85669.1 hypothetical protein Aud_001502 [Aspergillus udagawae]